MDSITEIVRLMPRALREPRDTMPPSGESPDSPDNYLADVAAAMRRRDVAVCLRQSGLMPGERQAGLAEVQPLPCQGEAWARAKGLLERLVDGIRAGARERRYPDWWVLLQSRSNGTGKSYLAMRAIVDCCRIPKAARFTTGIQLLDELRQAQEPDSDFGVAQVKQRYTQCPLLALDDLGKERPTPFASEALFDILDRRLRAARPVIITTNLTLAEIAERYGEHYGPAIASRIVGQCRAQQSRIVLDGGDARMGGI